jgi:hypothetical protein
MKIPRYKHNCIIQSGDMVGNKYHYDVPWWELDNTCPYCKQPLITASQLLEHIYRELTED